MLRSTQQHRPNATAPIVARLAEPLPKQAADQVFLAPLTELKPSAVAQFVQKREPQKRSEPAVAVMPQVVTKNSPAPSPIERAPSPDAGTLAQYRLSVLGAARRFKHYPDVAVENSWQGKVEVHMVIDSSGEISALAVRNSAGHQVLDQHALEIIERAKALAPIPPALRGKQFTVDVPVIFSLREAG